MATPGGQRDEERSSGPERYDISFSIVEARDLKPTHGSIGSSFEPAITIDLKNPAPNGVTSFTKLNIGSGVIVTPEERRRQEEEDARRKEAEEEEARQLREEEEYALYGTPRHHPDDDDREEGIEGTQDPDTEHANNGCNRHSPNSRSSRRQQQNSRGSQKGNSAGNSQKNSNSKRKPAERRGANLVYDLAKTSFQIESYPSRTNPLLLSINVKDADVLAPVDSVGQSVQALKLWHPADEDKELSEESKLACLTIEGLTWVEIKSPHPCPVGVRGITGHVLVRWCVARSAESISANYEVLHELLFFLAEQELTTMARKERRERAKLRGELVPVEDLQQQQEHYDRRQGSRASQRSTATGGSQQQKQQSPRKYKPYKESQYYNRFSSKECHQTSRPFSELVQSRENEYYTPVRPKKRPATDGGVRGGATTARAPPLPPSSRGSTRSAATTGGGGHHHSQRTSFDNSPRKPWSNDSMAAIGLHSAQGWIPTKEAKNTAMERTQHDALRAEEHRRMMVAAKEAQRVREEEAEETRKREQGEITYPSDEGDDDYYNSPSRRSNTTLLKPVAPIPAGNKNPHNPNKKREHILRALFQEDLRARKTEQDSAYASQRKGAFQSSGSKNVFDHLFQKNTVAFERQKGKRPQQASPSPSPRKGDAGREKTGVVSTSDGNGNEASTEPSKPKADLPPPNSRLYPKQLTSTREEAAEEAKKWKTRLAELRSKHPSAIQEEKRQQAAELDKLFA